MHRVVNVPHASNKRAQLTPVVDGESAKVVVLDPKATPPFNTTGVCDLYIGDHMFRADMRDALRSMVAHALVTAIEQARDAGYRQAQADIRQALGVTQ